MEQKKGCLQLGVSLAFSLSGSQAFVACFLAAWALSNGTVGSSHDIPHHLYRAECNARVV
jgi:hypothetical protein